MKGKVVEIDEADAKIRLLRQEIGAGFLVTVCLIVMVLIKIVPLEVPIINSFMIFIIMLGLVVGLATMVVSAFYKTEIQALNILFWGSKKFVLKEGKNEK